MILIITDIKPGEPDILTAQANDTLVICDLDGVELHCSPAPTNGWTTAALQSVAEQFEEGDAYLRSVTGQKWIGSSEI